MADPSFLLDLLEKASKIVAKGLKYKSTRKTLQSNVEELSPVVKQIEQCIMEMDRPTGEIQKLMGTLASTQGVLRKYSEIHWWTFYLSPYYQSKLEAAYESLESYISIQVQLQIKRDLMVMERDLKGDLKVMKGDLKVIRSALSLVEENNNDKAPKLEIPAFTVGLNGPPMPKLKFELLKDGGDQVLNLFGIAGSGKTTLAIKLCLDPEVKEKFENNIVFETLGSQKERNEHLANQLQDRLSKFGENPVLLVLDDVWRVSIQLVMKLRSKISSHCKILVTSRFEFKEFGTPHPMEPLSIDDAKALFLHSVQPPSEISSCVNDDEDIREILLQIVEGCKGLPLALKFVGSELYRKPIEFWKKMAKEWSQSHSILHSDIELLTRLENSLDVLEDESVNERFMDLGLFPEDKKIPVSAFIDMWIELYNLEEDGIYAMTLIYQLTDLNLVDIIVRRKVGSIADNYYNNHLLIQHGLLRELAIRLSSQETFEIRKRMIIDINENNIPTWWPQQQPQQGITARILSISTDQKITPDWCNIQAPKAEVLVLNLQTKEYDFPEFMKKMRNLKVLIVMNYGLHPTELKNLELLVSLLSLKRIRLQQVSVPYFCELKNVLKLSLYMCEVKKAFENCSLKISEALPNLVELNIDYCKDMVKLPAGLCDITTLKKLSISSCHNLTELPREIGNLEKLELLRVSSCAKFKQMPQSIAMLQRLTFLDISYCVSLTELPDGIDDLKNLRKLYIMGSSIRKLPYSFMNLENLKAVICDEETYALWDDEHPKLKKMAIDSSLNWLL